MVRKKTSKKKQKDFLFKIIMAFLVLSGGTIGGIVGASIENKFNKNNNMPETTQWVPPQEIENVSDIELKQDKPDDLYTIKYGDTLSEIVNSNYGKYDYKLLMGLAIYNNIKNVDRIYAGDTLIIPSSDILLDKYRNVTNTSQYQEQKTISSDVATSQDYVNAIKPDVSEINSEMNVAKSDISRLKTEMVEVKSDISEIKNDIATNKTDVAELQNASTQNTQDISEIKKDITSVKNDVDNIQENVASLETIVFDNDTAIHELQDKTEQNLNSINSLSKKVDANTSSVTTIEHNTLSNSDNIKSVSSQTKTNTNDIKSNSNEINLINTKLKNLESDFNTGKSTIEDILEKLNAIEERLDSLNNNSVANDEIAPVVSSEKISENKLAEEEIIPDFLEPKVYDEEVENTEPDNQYYEYVESENILSNIDKESVVSDKLSDIEYPKIINDTKSEEKSDASIYPEDIDPDFTSPENNMHNDYNLNFEQVLAFKNMKTR